MLVVKGQPLGEHPENNAVSQTNLRQVASKLFDLATESDQPLEIVETLPVALPETFQTALQILSPQRTNDNLTGQTATMFQESVARMKQA